MSSLARAFAIALGLRASENVESWLREYGARLINGEY